MSPKTPDNILDRLWAHIPSTPFCFMGLGLLRVWTGILYVDGPIAFPMQAHSAYFVFDMITAAVLLVLAVLSRRIAPLYRHHAIMPATALLLAVCALLNFGSLLYPWCSSFMVAWIALGCGATGVALFLMVWSEFFGCLDPVRVALYYSASVALSVLVLWVLKTTSPLCLATCMTLLPVILMLCLWRAYATLSAEDLPRTPVGSFSFPWKPVAVVTLYTFAKGMQISLGTGAAGVSSNVGMLAGGLIVYVGIARMGNSFDFSLLWKIAMPLMLISFLPLDAVIPFGADLSSTFSLTAYTLILILMMAILSNLSFRYGICALWLFAIERAVRLVSNQLGYIVGEGFRAITPVNPMAASIGAATLFFALILGVTLVFLSEKNIQSSWGVMLKTPLSKDLSLALEKTRLGVRTHELALTYNLTGREEEVLLLLLQRKKLADIANALCIEKNTAKTHIRHVYQKLDVHSRSELWALLGLEDE